MDSAVEETKEYGVGSAERRRREIRRLSENRRVLTHLSVVSSLDQLDGCGLLYVSTM